MVLVFVFCCLLFRRCFEFSLTMVGLLSFVGGASKVNLRTTGVWEVCWFSFGLFGFEMVEKGLDGFVGCLRVALLVGLFR